MKQKQENMQQDLEQRTGYEAPALTVVNFRVERGYAMSGNGGVTNYYKDPTQDW